MPTVNDKPVILVGLVVALVALTFPIWYALASGQTGPPPELKLPDGHCVEDAAFMRAHHMNLLDDWRNQVVREGKKNYVSKTYGETYEMSLTRTCLRCHGDRKEFCCQCHSYANVEPTCWNCHVESIEN